MRAWYSLKCLDDDTNFVRPSSDMSKESSMLSDPCSTK